MRKIADMIRVKKTEVAGIELTHMGLRDATAWLTSDDRPREHVHLCNVYTMALAHGSTELSANLTQAAVNIVDGERLPRLLGIDAGQRLRGPDLMRECLISGNVRHFIYGSRNPVVQELSKIYFEEPGRAQFLAGAHAPEFDSTLPSAGDLDMFARQRPDIIWVGLGTPKQDFVVSRIAAAIPDATVIAIGAAFDFLASAKPESPYIVRKHGMEWLHRLLTEPRRLFLRYLQAGVYVARMLYAGGWMRYSSVYEC